MDSKKQTGIELIAAEREKQIAKGYTLEVDSAANKFSQLRDAIVSLSFSLLAKDHIISKNVPLGWNEELWNKYLGYSEERKLAIIGAWCAAELDRRSMFHQNMKTVIEHLAKISKQNGDNNSEVENG